MYRPFDSIWLYLIPIIPILWGIRLSAIKKLSGDAINRGGVFNDEDHYSFHQRLITVSNAKFGSRMPQVRILSLGPSNDNPNYIIQVGNVFGFIISIENVL